MLWRALRENPPGQKFRRQHPIGRYIADFACPAYRLVIELDGSQHAKRNEDEMERTAELTRRGWRVIRFWNNEVLENTPGVIEAILFALETAPPHPSPLRPNGAEREK